MILDWKAILPGLIVTILVGLFCQFIFTLIASMIGGVHDTSFIASHKPQLWFVFALLTLGISMFIGGLFTALLSEGRGMANAIAVGILAGVLSLLVSITNSGLTWISLGVMLVGIVSAAVGSWACDRLPAASPVEAHRQ